MTEKLNLRGVTGYQLKMIALVFMVLDHIHQMFSPLGAPMWLTMAGRIVAPIFLYMAAEGFYHTRSRKKYLKRLWIASVLMSVGNIIIESKFPMEDVVLMNSMFGTLFLSVLYMWIIEGIGKNLRDRNYPRLLGLCIGLFIPFILGGLGLALINVNVDLFRLYLILIPSPFFVEGGVVWIFLGVMFYFLRDREKYLQVLPIIALAVFLYIKGDRVQPFMVLSALPIYLYNGQVGKKSSKYFFYLFYPAHIYILYLFAYFIRNRV